MKAEANTHLLTIWDPHSSEDELDAAYRWWSREIALWAKVYDREIPPDIYDFVWQYQHYSPSGGFTVTSGVFTLSTISIPDVRGSLYYDDRLPVGQTETLLR